MELHHQPYRLVNKIEYLIFGQALSDAEWALVAPYLTLMTEDAPQRDYPLREVFNGLRWMARGGSSWRMMPHDLPPWSVVYQQMRRWLKAEVFEAITHDLRAVLRIADGRQEMPTAAIFDSRTPTIDGREWRSRRLRRRETTQRQ